MAEVLRPMSTGELMDRTFALYKRNFKLFVGIAAIGPAAYLVFQLLVVGSAAVPGGGTPRAQAATGISFGFGVLAGMLVMLAGMAISHAATVKAVAAVHLGRPITIAEAYKSLKGRIWRIFGVFLVVMLITGLAAGAIIALAAIVGSLAFAGAAQAGRTGAILGGLFAVAVAIVGGVLAVAVYIRYSLAIASCVVEDVGIRASLKRSAFLSKGSRPRILAIYAVFFVLAMVVSLALGGLVGVAAVMIPNTIVRLVLTYLTSFIAGSLTGPLATIGIALIYYDERVRKEAFDLQLMMASLDGSAPISPAAAAVQP